MANKTTSKHSIGTEAIGGKAKEQRTQKGKNNERNTDLPELKT